MHNTLTFGPMRNPSLIRIYFLIFMKLNMLRMRSFFWGFEHSFFVDFRFRSSYLNLYFLSFMFSPLFLFHSFCCCHDSSNVLLNFMQFQPNFKLQISGMTPLMYAVKDNRTSYLDRLIELGSDVCARNNVGVFEHIL